MILSALGQSSHISGVVFGHTNFLYFYDLGLGLTPIISLQSNDHQFFDPFTAAIHLLLVFLRNTPPDHLNVKKTIHKRSKTSDHNSGETRTSYITQLTAHNSSIPGSESSILMSLVELRNTNKLHISIILSGRDQVHTD